jgi:hypothetical protein
MKNLEGRKSIIKHFGHLIVEQSSFSARRITTSDDIFTGKKAICNKLDKCCESFVVDSLNHLRAYLSSMNH